MSCIHFLHLLHSLHEDSPIDFWCCGVLGTSCTEGAKCSLNKFPCVFLQCAGAAQWALYLKAVMRGGAAIVSQSTMVLDVSSAWWDITPTPTVKVGEILSTRNLTFK